VLRATVLALLLTLTVAACGAHSSAPPAATTTATQSAAAARAKARACKNQAVALAKIHRDIAALQAAYELPVKDKLLGNHAINVATDKFLNDEELAPISNLKRNRLIDLAMSAIGTHCQQCFQALEAGRPIPAIHAGEISCSTS
jgi:ABC-type enterochelin transport system substrate-binding protein